MATYNNLVEAGAAVGRTTSAILKAIPQCLADAHDPIADLRRRLDAEAEGRRRLTLTLADQRAAPARRWWQFGR